MRMAQSASNKKTNVFKLHKDDQVSWNEAKMKRENDYQPWQIKLGSGKSARRFKAIKEGGVADNASYFVFYKSKDKSDTYEVCPVDEWYNVSATQRYKTLTAEQAEEQFEQRQKVLNLFSIMKTKGEMDGEGISAPDSKDFKVSELDDWDQSGDDDDRSGDDEAGGSGDDLKKKKKKKGVKKDKNDPDNVPEEAKEDSDEGDFEQREVDYMSDSSSDSSISEGGKDETDVRGIAEEQALRDLLSTDDEEDAENPESQKGSKTGDNNTKLGTVDIKREPGEDDSDDTSDSSDYDVDDEKMDAMVLKDVKPPIAPIKQEAKNAPEPSSSGAQRKELGSSETNKRKLIPETTSSQPAPAPKRPCPPAEAANSDEREVEELVRKYLTRKPMPLKALLKDVRSRMIKKKPDIDNSRLLETLASVIKRLQPDRKKINDVEYFSLKA